MADTFRAIFFRSLVLMTAVGFATVGAARTQAAVTLNLVGLGDSITQEALYLPELTADLHGVGIQDTFTDDGVGGDIIDGSQPGAPRMGLSENLPTIFSGQTINTSNTFILLMIGTNDVGFNYLPSTSQVQTRYAALLSEIHADAPLAHVIAAQITPTLTPSQNLLVQTFNSNIAGVINGPNTSMVDMYTPLVGHLNSTYFQDNLHPTSAGGTIMGDVWFAGIQAAIPEPSSIALMMVGAIGLLGSTRHSRRTRPLA